MKQMKRIVTAFVIGLSIIFGTAQANYLLAEDKLKFGQKNYFLIIAAEKSTGLKPDTFLQDRLNIQKKYEKICNDQVMVWHTSLISSTKPKWGKGYWFVFSFLSDSKFSVSSANKHSCALQGSYVKSGTPTDLFNGVSILASKQHNQNYTNGRSNTGNSDANSTQPTSQQVSNSVPDANGQCGSPTVFPVGTANSPSMVLLSKALKAKKLLEGGTIESRYEAATVVYNSISEIETDHASSEVGIGLLSGGCYGGVSLTTAKNDFIDAYSAFKSGACDSSPTRECLIAKALTTANAACGAGFMGYYPTNGGEPDSNASYSAATLAFAAIAEADTGLNDKIISEISEEVFRGCIDVMNSFDDRVYTPALIIAYIEHKMSVGKTQLAKENLKLLTGPDKLEAVFHIVLKDKKMTEKLFEQLKSFINKKEEKDDIRLRGVGGAEKFLMSLMLIEHSYKKGFSPNSNFFNDARKIQYNAQRAFESGAGLTCADYAPLYEAKLISALKYASLIGNEVSDDKWSWLIRSPIFSKCSSPYELKSDELRSIRLEALITMLRTQPFERANQIYNYLVNVESKLDTHMDASQHYKFVIAKKMVDEFNVMDENSKEIKFNENNCSWYQKFFESDNCPRWNLGTLGSRLQMRYLAKNNPCEAVKFMFNVSKDQQKNQTFPSWFTAEQIREAKNKPVHIDSNLLQLAMAEIDWTQAPNCGDAELELLLKE
jgi:hypothetical protein